MCSRFKDKFVDICEAILYGDLNRLKIEFEHQATVCKYIAPEGTQIIQKRSKDYFGEAPSGVKCIIDLWNKRLKGQFRFFTGVGVCRHRFNNYRGGKLAEEAAGSVNGRFSPQTSEPLN